MTARFRASKKLWQLLVGAVLVATAITTAVFYIQSRFESVVATTDRFYDAPSRKVWSHRGYSKDHQENSVEAFQAAKTKGAPGVELDVFFDRETNRFIVSHDTPTPDTTPLYLETVFDHIGPDIHYWLDFKNLAALNTADTDAAITRLTQLAGKNVITDQLLVESKSASHLARVKDKGFHTSLWVSLDKRQSWLRYQLDILRIKYRLGMNGLGTLSMQASNFDTTVPSAFPGADIYLFTVNDMAALHQLVQIDSVRIILTNLDQFGLGSS